MAVPSGMQYGRGRSVAAVFAGACCVMAAGAGCTSDSTPAASTSPASATSATVTTKPPTNASSSATLVPAEPSEAVYRKLCKSIRTVHVVPLFTTKHIVEDFGGSSDCAFHPRTSGVPTDTIRVYLRINDGDQTLWRHLGDHPYGHYTAVSIPGAQAKWGYQGGRLPSVVDARTGTFTCSVIPVAGGNALAAHQPGRVGAADYAGKLVHICEDVFAADTRAK